MHLLSDKHNSSYRVPVAVGDVVMDVSCRCCSPSPVRVLRLFDWGLRVRSSAPGFPEQYDCTRWERVA